MPRRFARTGGAYRLDVTNIAGGELGGADLQCLLINSDVDLAPDAPFRAAVLAGVPFPLALDLDACAVDQQVQRTLRPAKGDVDLQRLLTAAEGAEGRHRPVQADQPQEAFDKPSSPWSLGPVAFHGSICLSAMPNSTFIVRQV